MNVVVIDAGRLGEEAEFPPLEAAKFGWVQYPETAPEELPERCWRSHVIVTATTPIGAAQMAGLHNLGLIAIAGPGRELVDLEAARARGIGVCEVPGESETGWICAQVVANIDAFARGERRNRIV